MSMALNTPLPDDRPSESKSAEPAPQLLICNPHECATSTYVDVTSKIKQAVWRCMLGGNPYWVHYYNSDKTNKYSGINDKQASRGHVTHTGKDYTRYAYKPYYYTPKVVDQYKLSFGMWTRSKDGLYSFANADFEPLRRLTKKAKAAGKSRIIEKPTPKQYARTRTEASDYYQSWWHLALIDNRILAVYLLESSPAHYHVGVIFSTSLTRAEHDKLVGTARSMTMKMVNVDKYSTRAKQGKGDQFRAPWTWKHGDQSKCLEFWCRSESQLLERAAALAPPNHTSTKRGDGRGTSNRLDTSNHEVLLQWTIERYPILPHTRNKVQASLILSLLKCQVDPTVIRTIGSAWLNHFNNQSTEPDPDLQNFKTKPDQAIIFFNKCLDYTLNRPIIVDRIGMSSTIVDRTGKSSTIDYPTFTQNYRLTDDQIRLIGEITGEKAKKGDTSGTDVIPACFRDHILSDDSGKKCGVRSQNWCVVEAILVLTAIEKAKKLNRTAFTHLQILQTVQIRHGVEIAPTQLQRIKKRFVTFGLTNGSEHSATICELLQEVRKGTPGTASVYEVAPILERLLAQNAG
jgi:hypothetical protein